MRQKANSLLFTGLIWLIIMIIGGCTRATPFEVQASSTAVIAIQPTGIPETAIQAPPTQEPYPIATTPIVIVGANTPTPQLTAAPPESTESVSSPTHSSLSPEPSLTPLPSQTYTQQINLLPTSTETATALSEYPGPEVTPIPTLDETQPYPGPNDTPTSIPLITPINPPTLIPYPGPGSPVITSTEIPIINITPTSPAVGSAVPSPTLRIGTPMTTPVELPPRPPMTPPPAGSSVTIWHSWGKATADVLESTIKSFQRLYPNVTFTLRYIPEDDLLNKFHDSAYFGQGPTIMIGPSAWGPELFRDSLIADLEPYIPDGYFKDVNSAGLDNCEYHGVQVSIPISVNGMLIFRNTSILSTQAASLDELTNLSHQATHGGMVGTYLERGSYFSSAAITGLGGQLMDEGGNPLFNDAFGLEWLDLLKAYDDAGAVTFNTNYDLSMFKKGKVGIIIDGSWNIPMLAEIIGAEHLAIDPWPTFGTGHMSGWVKSECVFLNASASAMDRFAALSFIGYLLDPNVQLRFAEAGKIPSVLTTRPRDPLIMQAMVALADGVSFPNAVEEQILSVYWNELDAAIQGVFKDSAIPSVALQQANDNIRNILAEIKTKQAAP